MLSENGPFYPDANGNLTNNPYAWNTVANMVYIESPAGVGFSQLPGFVNYTDELTAADNLAVLQGIFKLYPQFENCKFMLSGESYAGHYVPMLAKLIWDQKKSDPHGFPQKNFRGFLLGNPSTDTSYDHKISKVEFYRMHAFMPLDETAYGTLPAGVSAYDILGDTCAADAILNSFTHSHPFVDLLRAENEAMEKRADPNRPVCISNYVSNYLNRADVQRAIHAQPTSWKQCGGSPFYLYGPQSIIPLYRFFYDNTDLSFWVFSGDVDTVISFVSTQSWILDMKIPYKSKWAPWYYSNPQSHNGKQLGGFEMVMQSGRFRYRTVRGAGHMVPWNRPAPALSMLQDYLSTL